MIETLILTTLVGRVVAHYADKALPLIDDGLRRMIEQAQDDPEAERQVDEQLARRIAENPDGAKSLATAVLERPEDPSAPQGPLDSYWRILLGSLDGVLALRPPVVALPGFYHGTDVVTVIDSRPSELTELGEPDRYLPWRTWDNPESDGRDGIGFFGLKEAIDAGMPRVFLLPGAGEDRDAKVVTLNSAFNSDNPPLALLIDRQAPELIGVDEGEVRQVRWIQEKAVVVEAPRASKLDRLSIEPQQRLPISGPEGVLMMRAALEDVIAERDLDAIKWRNAAS